MANTYAHYLKDLGQILRAEAVQLHGEGGAGDFERGQQFAFCRVLSLMQQQAEAFGLDLEELSLDGLDPERDVLAS